VERVALSSATDFAGWRAAARDLLVRDVPPEMVEWTAGAQLGGIFAEDSGDAAASASSGKAARFTVPRAFIELASTAILHTDPQRFALLYRLLWRLRDERGLLSVAVDPDVARANAMAKAVRDDMHKMRAFVRFREIDAGGPLYIAWFEPSHHIVEATAPFFARRFANRRWSILTPEASVHWDGAHLEMAPGAARADAPDDDQLETLWRTYYASIFNPARLNIAAMRSEMPKKYWRNLPEAELIAPLIASARQRTQQMIDDSASVPRRPRKLQRYAAQADGHSRIDPVTPGASLADVRDAAAHCRDCPLWKPATQTVFGEGAADARVMLVGEQAGDQEDLVGRPFVGPAGKLLDRALAAANIERGALYVTNAVKHFKFEPRGKRRIHKKPADAEIDACYRWLEREIALVKPALIVALGATAARAVTGHAMAVGANRGRITELPGGTKLMITVHPSYLLRVPAEDQEAEYERFVADLAHVAEYLATFRDAAPPPRPPQLPRADEPPRSNRNP
jgi:DNA polymerase